MSPFNFKSIQSLEIRSEDKPQIDFKSDSVVITAERDGEKIVITAQIPGVTIPVSKTTVSKPSKYSHPLKGRVLPATDSRSGSNNHLSKLNEEAVREIRDIAGDPDVIKAYGTTYNMCVELGKAYKVHHTTIYNIINRVSWKHV